MYPRVRIACDGCRTSFTCAPEQAKRALGKLCGKCLSNLPWIQPPGYTPPLPDAIAGERAIRKTEFHLPPECFIIDDAVPQETIKQHRQAIEAVERLLDSTSALRCLAPFWKKQIWQVVKEEGESVVTSYRDVHLRFLETYIEPLTGRNGHSGFSKVCTDFSELPDLCYLASNLGCAPPEDETDVGSWLTWAVEKEDDASICLYCLAGFVAVPPYLGPVPITVDGPVKTMAGESLVRMNEYSKATNMSESFLSLTSEDYVSLSAMTTALTRSSIGELEIDWRKRLIMTLAEALPHVTGRGPSHAALLRDAYRRLT